MNAFQKITEESSRYRHLEKMSINELLVNINAEDQTVPLAVEKAIPQIERLVSVIADKMLAGGRLFYIGAGNSGRLAMVDASECTPTYDVPAELVIAVIAGGEIALTKAVENAEDSKTQGWHDLKSHHVNGKDVVIGIAASGTTPYVIAALKKCREHGVVTGCITNNPGSPIVSESDFPIEVVVGPEFVTGSTRMKSGTSQKLVLNMISTTVMIQLGRVEDNKMVNMLLSNEKLLDRGTKMLMEQLNLINYDEANKLLRKYGSVKKAAENFQQSH